VDEDVAILEHGLAGLRVGHEVRAEVALIELHALDVVERGLGGLAVLDLDDAVRSDLGDRFGDELADLGVVVGGDGGDLLVVGLALAGRGDLVDRGRDGLGGGVDAALQVHGVGTGGDVLEALVEDRLSEDGGAGGAVAGLVGGLLRDLVHHLGAHGLEGLGELDFLRDAHAVLGDLGAAEGTLDRDVPARGAHGALHGVGEAVNTLFHLEQGGVFEHDLLLGHGCSFGAGALGTGL
jgi:hypothetical protein